MRSYAGSPDDGHTLANALEQVEALTDQRPDLAVVYRGYRGHGVERTQVLISGQRRGMTLALARQLKRLSAIEPEIGHMKTDGHLACCPLKGAIGDAIFTVLCGCSHNIRKMRARIRAWLSEILAMPVTAIGWATSSSTGQGGVKSRLSRIKQCQRSRAVVAQPELPFPGVFLGIAVGCVVMHLRLAHHIVRQDVPIDDDKVNMAAARPLAPFPTLRVRSFRPFHEGDWSFVVQVLPKIIEPVLIGVIQPPVEITEHDDIASSVMLKFEPVLHEFKLRAQGPAGISDMLRP